MRFWKILGTIIAALGVISYSLFFYILLKSYMYPPALIRREAAQVPRLLRSLSKEEIAGKRVIGIYHKCDDYDIAFRCWWGDEYIQFYLDLMVIEFGALGSSGEEAITSLRDTEVNTLFSRHLQGINPQLLSFKNGFIYYTE